VLTAAAGASALILGAGLWAAHGSARAASRPAAGKTGNVIKAVKVSSTVQRVGSARLIRTMYQITVAGTTRQWIQLTPAGRPTGSEPIIVVLSGVNATVSQEIARDHLTSYRAELVYPVPRYESWNAGGCCGRAAKYGVNDVAFVTALVAAVDPVRAHPITLAGYSNGGRLAYRIACTDPGLVDSYVIVKAMPQPGCAVRRPLTILQVDSTNDPEVPYQPGDKGRESPAATVQVARLRAAADATGPPAVLTRGALRLSTWPGKDGTRVAFAVYRTGAHLFPQAAGTTPSGAAVIWSFVTHTAP
jgi:polyhydroxybutyrate depolymerase